MYNQAQNVVSFDTGFTIYFIFYTTLGCDDAAFAKFFIEKLPVNHFVRNVWTPLMDLKSYITIFTRVLLCTVSWVNVHIPQFSRTENYRVCAEGMFLFSIKEKRFDLRHVTIRYFRSLTSKDERTKCKYFSLHCSPIYARTLFFLKFPCFSQLSFKGKM